MENFYERGSDGSGPPAACEEEQWPMVTGGDWWPLSFPRRFRSV